MSAAIELIESLQQQGVQFELAGDKVKFRGDRDLLTPDRIEALKQSKGEVIEFLRKGAPPKQPNKVGVGGRPVTWTGKVVSLDEWRRLSDWERYGPNGRVWNGKTQKWERANEQ